MQSGSVWYDHRFALSCRACARTLKLKWFWSFFQGECEGCGCTLDPLWDNRTDNDSHADESS